MKNLKILNNKNKNLKERTKMKKFISSVLVFALVGVPVVSSAFAAKENQERLVILYSQREEIEKSLDELYKELADDINTYGDAYDKDYYVKRGNDLQSELEKVEASIKKIEEQDAEVSENVPNDEQSENQNENEKQEETNKKTGMSTTKKLLITVASIAALVGAGYAAYTYCPAVKDLVDNNVLPYAKGLVDATKTKANGYFASAQNLMNNTIAKTKNIGNTIKTQANDYYASAQNLMSSAASKTKDLGNAMKTKANGCLISTKKLITDTTASAKNLGNTAKTKASGYFASAKNFMNSAASKTKNLSNTMKIKANGCLTSAQNLMSKTVASAKNLGNTAKTKATGYFALAKNLMSDKALPKAKNLSVKVGENILFRTNDNPNGICPATQGYSQN